MATYGCILKSFLCAGSDQEFRRSDPSLFLSFKKELFSSRCYLRPGKPICAQPVSQRIFPSVALEVVSIWPTATRNRVTGAPSLVSTTTRTRVKGHGMTRSWRRRFPLMRNWTLGPSARSTPVATTLTSLVPSQYQTVHHPSLVYGVHHPSLVYGASLTPGQ